MTVEITEADFQLREGSGTNMIPARVSFSTAVKNPIDLEFVPLTYDQFFAMGLDLPPEFPSRDVEASSTYVDVIQNFELRRWGRGRRRKNS